VLVLILMACGGGPAGRPHPVGNDVAQEIPLAAGTPFAELEIPDSSRPGGLAPAEDIPLDGPWTSTGPNHGMQRYEADLPVRPRGLFFDSPQPGMDVVGPDGAVLPYERGVPRKFPYWNHDRDTITVCVPPGAGAPAKGELHLRWPKAVQRERALNYGLSGISSKEAFVRMSIQAEWDSRSGLLIPAPGRVAWDVTMPPSAELDFAPGLVAPEVLDARGSDGAWWIVEVEEGGSTTQVASGPVSPGEFSQQRVDLSRWSGRAVRVRFRSEVGSNPDFDYVFLGEPVIASRKADPKTVLMVFVDTLRRDHVGTYGYERATTKPIDAWAAAHAVVFDDARSVAPWTLPSARTIITGRQPEEYGVADALPKLLRERGWATAMIAGNVYLSPNFDMNRDWDLQHVTNWPQATEVTALAQQWLEEHEGRDRLLLVHYMDPHLPYQEPAKYRHMFAGVAPPGFSDRVNLGDIKRVRLDDAGQQWIKDRYDGNVAYAADEAAKVIAMTDPGDVVLFFADHGEEFWDHRGFEHGHTLFDELLRVPLMIQAPGFAPGRAAAPVSLLDVTPTILDLLGIEGRELDGRSLAPLMRGDAGAADAFVARDQAFGRPLYGNPRWGVLHEQEKWTTSEGREALFDLATDPRETDNLLKPDQPLASPEWRSYLGNALDRDVDVGWRMLPGRATGDLGASDFVVKVTVPGGIKAAWPADDPLKSSEVEVVLDPIDATGAEPVQTATFTWLHGWRGTREAYVVPNLPPEQVADRVAFDVTCAGDTKKLTFPPAAATGPGAVRMPTIQDRIHNRGFTVSWETSPAPHADTSEVIGADDEMRDALKALGYTEEQHGEQRNLP
jgi:arylsulfatase A-like enzyme